MGEEEGAVAPESAKVNQQADVQSGNRAGRAELVRRNFVGQSKVMQEVFELIESVADSDSTILIFGESGTGKELVAQAIHEQSPRAKNYFVPVNCGAIPHELLESEFFGHVKGAFTGATCKRDGRFKIADGGTIFLDEIGNMSPSLQVKILRVLQDKSFEPVGSTKTEHVDVRVIAATNIELEAAVREGRFREDLYYRLHVIPIQLPPLRERREDIPLLVDYFIKQYNQEKSRNIGGILPEALQVLCRYDWPGNVRECQNVIQRLVVLKREGVIQLEDLPPKLLSASMSGFAGRSVSVSMDIPPDGIDFNEVVEAFENQLLVQALEKTNWNKNRAAQLLNINRTTLVEKLKKKNIRKVG